MSCNVTKKHDISIPEGTTRYIVVYVKNQQGNADDLSGYDAYMYLIGTDKTEKTCMISGNEISVNIEPQDTIGQQHIKYEIRIYKENEVYEIARGTIHVEQSIHPLRDSETMNKEGE